MEWLARIFSERQILPMHKTHTLLAIVASHIFGYVQQMRYIHTYIDIHTCKCAMNAQ